MTDILDYLMIAGGTYYIMSKIKEDNDDGAKSMLLGIGAGILVGYKGPQLYKKFKEMSGTPEGAVIKDKLIAAGIAAGAGYLFGDKLLNSAKGLIYGKKDKTEEKC